MRAHSKGKPILFRGEQRQKRREREREREREKEEVHDHDDHGHGWDGDGMVGLGWFCCLFVLPNRTKTNHKQQTQIKSKQQHDIP